MSIKFSVIVPVYNVQDYLEQCIKSIALQSYTNFEMIVIDDGSTDQSGKICDEMAEQFRMIRVIHQKNAGLSAARNAGMAVATGDYILFVDSDDYIDLCALEMFSKLIGDEGRGPDVIAGIACAVSESGNMEEYKLPTGLKSVTSGQRFLTEAIRQNTFLPCAQFYVYKRKFLCEQRLSFYKGILHEDELWSVQVLLKAQNVKYSNFRFYFYRIREGSITRQKNKRKNAEDLLFVCKTLDELCQHYEKRKTVFIRDRIAMLYMNAVFIGGMNLLSREKVERFFPWENAKTLRNRCKAALFALSPKLYILLDKSIKHL